MGDKIEVSEMNRALCDFLKNEVLSDGTDMNENSSLAEIGVDSYSLMEIVLFVEREFGIALPMELLTPDNTQSVTTLTTCIQSIDS